MSNPWSWYIILGTIVSLAACFWLVAYANRQRASAEEIKESIKSRVSRARMKLQEVLQISGPSDYGTDGISQRVVSRSFAD